jgi:hypothetical protein
MSYLTIKKLQYGATRAQESVLPTSTLSDSECADIHTYLREYRGRRLGGYLGEAAAVDVDRQAGRNRIDT